MADIEKICADAIEMAAKLNIHLNYQPEDVDTLDRILLPKCSEWLSNGTIDKDGAWNAAVMFGVYLGETMLRNFAAEKGYQWATPDGNFPVLMKNEKNHISRITKVHKRILNGMEDSVRSFYNVAVYIADGRFDEARQFLTPAQEQ